MENNVIELTVRVDLNPIVETIEKANDLGGDVLFAGLTEIVIEKAKLKDALELVEAAEQNVKRTINDKAKALYGTDWTAIKGNKYKITRSKTGNVYEIIDDKVARDFLKVEVKPDTDAIGKYQLEHNELPEGVALNPERGESIRITVK